MSVESSMARASSPRVTVRRAYTLGITSDMIASSTPMAMSISSMVKARMAHALRFHQMRRRAVRVARVYGAPEGIPAGPPNPSSSSSNADQDVMSSSVPSSPSGPFDHRSYLPSRVSLSAR